MRTFDEKPYCHEVSCWGFAPCVLHGASEITELLKQSCMQERARILPTENDVLESIGLGIGFLLYQAAREKEDVPVNALIARDESAHIAFALQNYGTTRTDDELPVNEEHERLLESEMNKMNLEIAKLNGLFFLHLKHIRISHTLYGFF